MDDPTLPGIKDKSDHDLLLILVTSQHYIRRDVVETKTEIKAQNGRIRNLEDWRTRILGGFAVLAGATPLLIGDVRGYVASLFGG